MKINRPSDLQLERSLLSSVIFNPETRMEIIYELEPLHFTFPPHVTIFMAMKALTDSNVMPTANNLLHILKSEGKTEAFSSVSSLYDEFQPPELIQQSISKLKKIAFYNRVISQCEDGIRVFATIDKNTPDRLDSWNDGMHKIFSNYTNSKATPIADVLSHAYDNPQRSLIQDIQKRQDEHKSGIRPFTGHPTHYKDLDKMFDGFQNGHLTVIGARPGVGKTSFMLNLVLNTCLKGGCKAGIFSLEMPSISLVEKLAFSLARVDFKRAKTGDLAPAEFQRIVVASKELEKQIIVLDDTAKLNVYTLGNRIKHWKEAYEVNIVFIDYLQLLTSSSPGASKYESITDISQQLKIISKECDIPIVCLAQLNRNAAKDIDSTPRISDLRDSGAIEQDSDEIFLLHCPSLEDAFNKPGILQVYIGKNRFGQTGKFELAFEKNTGFIGDYSPLKMEEQDDPFKAWGN